MLSLSALKRADSAAAEPVKPVDIAAVEPVPVALTFGAVKPVDIGVFR